MINDVDVVGSGFIVHAPTAVDELEPSVGDQISGDVSSLFILVVPPSLEECHFGVNESVQRSDKVNSSLFE